MKEFVLLWLLLFLVCWVSAQDPGRYDVVIHEIFADPTPSRGMPASEFIEIRNRSATPWNLKNWTISNGSTVGRINTSFLLLPDSMVTLCGSTALSAYQILGSTVVVSSFPGLNNDGDTIQLFSSAGKLVHAIAWNKTWYGNDVKEEGGWSLEMIDISKPCLEARNWVASHDPRGATPGKKNSVEAQMRDTIPPLLQYGFLEDSVTAVLVWSAALSDSKPFVVQTEPQIAIKDISIRPPLFNMMVLRFDVAQQEGALLQLQLDKVDGCNGRGASTQSTTVGLFSGPHKNDVIINEVLFNPPSGGFDYVELYNPGQRTFDIARLQLANRNTDNKISSLTALSPFSYPLLPGEYLLVSTNIPWTKNRFQPPDLKKYVQPPSLPTYPDDKGEVILLDDTGGIIDELNYDEKWHFGMVANKEGISLERISASNATNDPRNWHSASTSAGFGTPGYRNSQAIFSQPDSGTISLSTGIISPDMDGRDDFLLINYHFPAPGTVATVTAFDSRGRAVRSIARSHICGIFGNFRWDGLNEAGTIPPRGVYIILTEVFDLQGKTKSYRHTVALYR